MFAGRGDGEVREVALAVGTKSWLLPDANWRKGGTPLGLTGWIGKSLKMEKSWMRQLISGGDFGCSEQQMMEIVWGGGGWMTSSIMEWKIMYVIVLIN